jgi:RHS repeat-associated protein
VRFLYAYSNTPTKENLFFLLKSAIEKQGAKGKIDVNYYPHGPLARVEYGNDQSQGIDYAYTLQGWIKGVNSNTLDAHRDMGVDGDTTLPNPNKNFAKDGFGYTLNYFAGDYKAISSLKWSNATDRFEAVTAGSDLAASTHDLYNGNISSMVSTIVKPTITPGDTMQFIPLPQGTAYKYDQLNRLIEMKAWQNIDSTNNEWDSGLTYAGKFYNKYTYDADGSLLTALAKNQSGQIIDNQIYYRQTIAGKKISNRTYAITDSASITSGNDLLDQDAFDNIASTINSVNNYAYTEIGERKSNKQDSIDLITWTVYGKIKSVTRSTGSTKNNLVFDYDASGNRIAKHIYTSANDWLNTEYYIRDAQGSIMSTYEYKMIDSTSSSSFVQTEKQIYGSSLLGIDVTKTEMIGASPAGEMYSHIEGNRHYTGNNHLGNVLITFTDRKLPVDLNSDGIIDEFWPDVIASNDYAPFGSLLTERTFNKNTFPNSFNGKRDDAELDMQDYGMRMYSPMEREFATVDPLAMKFPFYTPYQFAGNTPIQSIDMDGLEDTHYTMYLDKMQATPEGAQKTIKEAKDAAPYMAAASAFGLTAVFAPIIMPAIGSAISAAGPPLIAGAMTATQYTEIGIYTLGALAADNPDIAGALVEGIFSQISGEDVSLSNPYEGKYNELVQVALKIYNEKEGIADQS